MMEERLRSWWQFIKTNRITIQFVAIFLVIAIILILIGYQFDWTGFNVYTVTVKSNATSGTTLPTNITVYLPSKTLYDWMQLLFIPVVLAVAGFWFNHRERKSAELRADNERKAAQFRAWNEQTAAKVRAEAEREIASDNQREAALQAYINEMSELLLHENLRNSKEEDEVRSIAHVRTLTVLPRLDPTRKGSVVQFLYNSGLINTDNTVISLKGTDLSRINLSHAMLTEANLGGIELSYAELSGADLRRVNLSFTNLTGANLLYANLILANLHTAELGKAFLERADLNHADLRFVILTDAHLEKAHLCSANLDGSIFEGAYFDKADLSKAIVDVKQLEKEAKSLKGATMPDGSIHP